MNRCRSAVCSGVREPSSRSVSTRPLPTGAAGSGAASTACWGRAGAGAGERSWAHPAARTQRARAALRAICLSISAFDTFPVMVCLYVQKFQPVGAAAQADGLGALQGVDAVAARDPLGQGFVAGGGIDQVAAGPIQSQRVA